VKNYNLKFKNIFRQRFVHGFVFLFCIFTFILINFSHAAINKQMNYQGKLTNTSDVAVPYGFYDMVFKIYDGSSTLLWTGTYTAANGNAVEITNGIFSVMLGSGTGNELNLNFEADTYYLGVTVSPDVAEMAPRKRLGSVPQAINSLNVIGDGYINIDNTSPAQDAANINYNPTTGTNNALSVVYGSAGGTGTALSVTQAGTGYAATFMGGNVGIGTTNPNGVFEVKSGATSLLSVSSAGNVTAGGYFYATSTVNSPSIRAQSDNGTLTVQNRNFTSAMDAVDMSTGTFSNIDSGASVAVAIKPIYNQASGAEANTDLLINRTETALGSGLQYLINAGTGGGTYTSKFSVTNTGQGYFGGNVGIGTTSPGSKLQVNGNAVIGYAAGTATTANGLAISGNVGIGTTSPGALLTLVKADSSALTDLLINPTAKTSGNFVDFQINGSTRFNVDYTGWATVTGVRPGNSNGVLYLGHGSSSTVAHDWVNITPQLRNTSGAGNGLNVNAYFGANTANMDGTYAASLISPIWNMETATSEGVSYDLLINRTETNLSTGIQRLISAGTGGGTYIEKFGVSNTGQGYFAGNVGIGTTNPTHKLLVYNNAGTDTAAVMGVNDNTIAANIGYGGYFQNNQGVGSYMGRGVYGIYCTAGAVGGCAGNDVWTNLSDARLKTEVSDLSETSGLDAILKLRPVNFRWKDSKRYSAFGEQIGFLAQDVEKIFPDSGIVSAAGRSETITLADGTTEVVPNVKSLSYASFVVPLVKAVQEQQTQIADVNLKTSQNVETVGQLQKSVDDNLSVISGNFSAVNTQLALHESTINEQQSEISNFKFQISNQIQNLNEQVSNLNNQYTILDTKYSILDTKTGLNEAEKSDLISRLTAAETKLLNDEHDLITFEKGTNDTLSSMLDTEDMLTNRVLDHEDRLKALEAKLATATVSATVVASGEIPANAVTQDALGNATLAGVFTAKGIVAGSLDVKNLKLGTQTSGSAKILSGQTEIPIPSTEAKVDSKIYVTPTGSTFGKILYVGKEAGDIIPGESFKVKFDGAALTSDVQFNWLVVN
jgi:hypothetical protein